MQKIRGMKSCHTKGILIDSRWTVIGSHNWTNEGTNFNRDASLIIDDPEVTKYFEEVVEHDWNSLSYSIDYDMETPVAILPLPGESIDGATERLEASRNAIDDG
jgi:phosphatidylserine/phosphatidylglycerophosphate/cardiolipin synthase-like enzyme